MYHSSNELLWDGNNSAAAVAGGGVVDLDASTGEDRDQVDTHQEGSDDFMMHRQTP